MRLWLLIVLSLIFIFNGFSQEPSYKVIGKKELIGLDIYSIKQNPKGLIYLGTNDGIYKHDGQKISKLKGPKLNDKSFFGFKTDLDGKLFCYNLKGEVFQVFEDSISLDLTLDYTHLDDYFSFEFNSLNEMMFSCDHPFIKDVAGNIRALDSLALEDVFISKSHKTDNGEILFYNLTKSILYIYKDQKIEKLSLDIDTLSQIELSSDKNFIYVLDGKHYTVHKVGENKIEQILLKPEDRAKKPELFKVYENGLMCVTLANGGFYLFSKEGKIRYGNKPLFESKSFSATMIDMEGNYWVTTLENAIFYFVRKPFKSYINLPILEDEFLNRVAFCPNGNLYIGSMSGKIFKDNKNEIGLFATNNNVKINYLEYKDKTLYSSFFYQREYDDSKYAHEEPNRKLIQKGIEQNNEFTFYANSKGLRIYDNILKRDSIFLHARIHKIKYIEQKQLLWIASNKGLFIYHNRELKSIKVLENYSMPIDIQIYEDKVWVATESDGVFLVDQDEVMFHLKYETGLVSEEINKIIYKNNVLYISHNKGLQIFNPHTKTWKIINSSNGLFSNKIRDFDVFENQIAIVTHLGLQRISIDKITFSNYKPIIEFKNVFSNKKVLDDSNSFLNYDDNNISLSFAAYAFQHEIEYEYCLIKDESKGIQWSKNPASINYVKFPSLSPGEYEFRVKAVTDHGIESETLSYTFTIGEPFWRTWVFWVVMGFLVFDIVYVIYRRNIAKIKKENKFKAELTTSKLTALKSQMNPHFIFNALNSIQALVLKQDIINSYEYIVKFSTLVRHTLNYSEQDFIDFEDELKLLTVYLELEELRFNDSFEFDINVTSNISGGLPPMLIQPFVENAIKHGLLHKEGKKNIKIDFELRDSLICTIIDNGIGRVKSQEMKKRQIQDFKSFSISSIQKRFNLLEEIYSEEIGFEITDLYKKGCASGTKVLIKIPFKKSF